VVGLSTDIGYKFEDGFDSSRFAGCDLVLLCNQSLPLKQGETSPIDALIAGLTQAQIQGRWQASDSSEERRWRLLPQSMARPWDDLMVSADYMQALDWLP
jgi:beta-N-acetylhexosaminidase